MIIINHIPMFEWMSEWIIYRVIILSHVWLSRTLSFPPSIFYFTCHDIDLKSMFLVLSYSPSFSRIQSYEVLIVLFYSFIRISCSFLKNCFFHEFTNSRKGTFTTAIHFTTSITTFDIDLVVYDGIVGVYVSNDIILNKPYVFYRRKCYSTSYDKYCNKYYNH